MAKLTSLVMASVLVLAGCSGISPKKQRDIAFQKYSLDCVAQGIPDNTPAHTKCVMSKYEAHHREQKRAEVEMANFYGIKTKKAGKTAASSNSQ